VAAGPWPVGGLGAGVATGSIGANRRQSALICGWALIIVHHPAESEIIRRGPELDRGASDDSDHYRYSLTTMNNRRPTGQIIFNSSNTFSNTDKQSRATEKRLGNEFNDVALSTGEKT
jgi:hypothetical protein